MGLRENLMKLKKLRLERKLSVIELAAAAHVSFLVIYAIERGNHVPTLRTINKLAAALDCDPKELI
jgi:transcriptional regulator with XRE-family HTH domain